MDSINTLASSLPASNLAAAEKELLNDFKAAALSITTLYRSSKHTSKRAYNAGYAACLTDVLAVIQDGVSAQGDEMTIGRVMDWTEARLQAIRAREEEEEEEERGGGDRSNDEREREREHSSKPAAHTMPAPTSHPDKENTAVGTRSTYGRPSASPPPPSRKRSVGTIAQNTTAANTTTPFAFTAPFTSPDSANAVNQPVFFVPPVGSKRRFATMMESSPFPPFSTGDISSPTIPRRRKPSRHGHNFSLPSTSSGTDIPSTPMDVEEEGRERKRVARR